MDGQPSRRMFKDAGLIYLGLLLAWTVLSLFFWQLYHAEITYKALEWSWYALGIFDWSFMPGIIRQWRNELAMLARQAGALTFSDLLTVLNHVGYFFVWVPLLMTIRAVRLAMRHRANKTRRVITVQTLPQIMAEHAPGGIPVLYYGDLLNEDPPEQRWAQHPEEWVAQHGLLLNRQLDVARCRELFQAQLGDKISSPDELRGAERALFAIFAIQVCSRGEQRDKAIALLDDLNRSCHGHTFNGKRGYPNLRIADKEFKVHANHPEMLALVRQHPFARTFLSALHKRACYSGDMAVVTSATLASVGSGDFSSTNFRWLKGMDRTLWYVLNCTGRKKPFVENAGVYTQTLWEQFVADVGYVLEGPYVDDAVDGLHKYLIKAGLVVAPKEEKK